MNTATTDNVTKIGNIASIVCAMLHILIVLHNINKRGTVTKKDAINLLLDGVIVGYALHKAENYLGIKLDELKKEMGDE